MGKFEEHEAMYHELMRMERCIDRDIKLDVLMKKIELSFDMPRVSSKEWDAANPEVAELYNRVADARIF